MTKTVFVVMCAEFLHPGHVNIIKVARELGEVTVGLATDEFNARYKRLAWMSYEQRKIIVENIKGVERVIPQETLDLPPILRAIKPDYFVHGDDWKTGSNQEVRQKVIEVLKEWGGTLVEPPYTEGVSSTQLDTMWRTTGTTPELRRQRLRRLLAFQPFVRILEVHDTPTGWLAEQAQVKINGKVKAFDAMWYTTESFLPAKSDNGSAPSLQEHILRDLLGKTTNPLIVEITNGGQDFVSTLKTLERLGASAGVVNGTAFSGSGWIPVENVQELAHTISAVKETQGTADFPILVRIHLQDIHQGADDLLLQAQAYAEAGADALIISGHSETFAEGFDFCRLYAKLENKIPLLTTLPAHRAVHERELVNAGIKGILYSDQSLRIVYTSMMKAAEALLGHSSPQN